MARKVIPPGVTVTTTILAAQFTTGSHRQVHEQLHMLRSVSTVAPAIEGLARAPFASPPTASCRVGTLLTL